MYCNKAYSIVHRYKWDTHRTHRMEDTTKIETRASVVWLTQDPGAGSCLRIQKALLRGAASGRVTDRECNCCCSSAASLVPRKFMRLGKRSGMRTGPELRNEGRRQHRPRTGTRVSSLCVGGERRSGYLLQATQTAHRDPETSDLMNGLENTCGLVGTYLAGDLGTGPLCVGQFPDAGRHDATII